MARGGTATLANIEPWIGRVRATGEECWLSCGFSAPALVDLPSQEVKVGSRSPTVAVEISVCSASGCDVVSPRLAGVVVKKWSLLAKPVRCGRVNRRASDLRISLKCGAAVNLAPRVFPHRGGVRNQLVDCQVVQASGGSEIN